VDEVKGLIGLVADWSTLLIAVLIFSFVPHLLLHLVLLLYPKGNKRPAQILADLFDVPRWKKPFWVVEMALMAIFEAVPLRLAARREGRQKISRTTWHLITINIMRVREKISFWGFRWLVSDVLEKKYVVWATTHIVQQRPGQAPPDDVQIWGA
jgi:hypothetical protein